MSRGQGKQARGESSQPGLLFSGCSFPFLFSATLLIEEIGRGKILGPSLAQYLGRKVTKC